MRMKTDDAVDVLVRLDQIERVGPGDRIGADRDDPGHPGVTRPRDCCFGILERVEMRVRVDHVSVRRASSSATMLGSSFRKSGSGSRSFCPAGSSLGSQRPIQPE